MCKLTRNLPLVKRLTEFAAAKGIPGTQLAIAWVPAKDNSIIAVIGARTRSQLSESLSALSVQLTSDELAHMESAIPLDAVAGTRYAPEQMKVLDSEER